MPGCCGQRWKAWQAGLPCGRSAHPQLCRWLRLAHFSQPGEMPPRPHAALTAAGPGVLCPSPDAPAIYPHRRGEERKCLEVLCWPRSRLAGCSSASPQEGSTAGTRAVGEGGCACRRNRRAPAPGEGCLGQGSEGRQLLLLFHLSGIAHTGPLGSRHSCLQGAWEPACTTSSLG